MRTMLMLTTLAMLGCGSPPGVPRDAGPPVDAPTPGIDALARDAPGTDTGPAPDAPVLDAPVLDAPGTDAPALDAGPPLDPTTRAGFARRVAELLCAAWAVCPRCTPPTPTCVATMEERSLRDPPENFHPERALAYLALLEEAYAGACEQITPREHVDNYPYYGPGAPAVFHADGTVTLGDVCVDNDDCQTRDCRSYSSPFGLPTVTMCYPAPAPSAREPLCR